MSNKYKNLNELQLRKQELLKEMEEMEEILKFKNKTKSLSVLTNGLSDKYITEKANEDGTYSTVIKKDAVIKTLSSNVRNKVANRNSMVGIANQAMKAGVMDDIFQLGTSTILASIAKKQLKSKSFFKKILGYSLIYLAPYAIKMITKKLSNYQRERSVSSMEKLI